MKTDPGRLPPDIDIDTLTVRTLRDTSRNVYEWPTVHAKFDARCVTKSRCVEVSIDSEKAASQPSVIIITAPGGCRKLAAAVNCRRTVEILRTARPLPRLHPHSADPRQLSQPFSGWERAP